MINLNSQDGSNAFDQQNKRIMTVLHTQKNKTKQNKNKIEMVLTRKTKKINLLDRSRSRCRWCLDFPFLDRRLPPKIKRRRIHPKKHFFFFILLKREKYYSWCYFF